MDAWPLRTTATDTLEEDIEAVHKKEKAFLWRHYSSPEEKHKAVILTELGGLTILDGVPIWFLLACHPEVPHQNRYRMISSIHNSLAVEDSLWRGVQFGYSEPDVYWYINEVEEAKKRFFSWHQGVISGN